MDCVDPYDSDSAGSEISDSFGERQLTAAEAEAEPLPAFEGLCISGVPHPGCLLTLEGRAAGGASFAWVRCFEDGSSSYIDGQNKATYLVTADDVDSFLAIEAIPIGGDERMGEMIRKYANDHKKISCDLEMYEQIEKAFFVGNASFNVSILVDQHNNWEKAKLEIGRNGFCIIQLDAIYMEKKFSASTAVTIPCDSSTGFLLQQEIEVLLSAETSLLRDVIVLTMRLFLRRAIEKDSPISAKKRRKKFLFF